MSFTVFTPNLALDRTLTLSSRLTPHALNRVKDIRVVAGGKGVNVARVLTTLGAQVEVTGFVAGLNGQKFQQLLAEEGLTGTFQEVDGEMRECHILIDDAPQPTEVYEQGPLVTRQDWRQLIAQFHGEQLVISGSLPVGINAKLFKTLLTELTQKPVVDSSGDALKAALEAGVGLVKPNQAELHGLVSFTGDGLQEAKTLFEVYGVPILLSMGAQGAAYIAETTHQIAAPDITVHNPVASGDSLLAAFLWARSKSWSLCDALRLGVASGVENAASGGGARMTKSAIMSRLKQMA